MCLGGVHSVVHDTARVVMLPRLVGVAVGCPRGVFVVCAGGMAVGCAVGWL